jgi:hypothetical protein
MAGYNKAAASAAIGSVQGLLDAKKALKEAKEAMARELRDRKITNETNLTQALQEAQDELIARKQEIEAQLRADEAAALAIRNATDTIATSQQLTVSAAHSKALRKQAEEVEKTEKNRVREIATIEKRLAREIADVKKETLEKLRDEEKELIEKLEKLNIKRTLEDGERYDKDAKNASEATVTAKEILLNAREATIVTQKTTAAIEKGTVADNAQQAVDRYTLEAQTTIARAEEQQLKKEAKEAKNEGRRGGFSFFSSSSATASSGYAMGVGSRDIHTKEWQLDKASVISTQLNTASGGVGIGVAALGFIEDATTIGKNYSDRNHTDLNKRRDAVGDLKSAAANIGIRSIDVTGQSVALAVTVGATTVAAGIAAPFVAATASTASMIRSGVRIHQTNKHLDAVTNVQKSHASGLSPEMKGAIQYTKDQLGTRRKKMVLEGGIAALGVGASVALGVAAITAAVGTAALMATPVGWGLAIGAAAIGLGYLAYKIYRKKYKAGGAGTKREETARQIVLALTNNDPVNQRAAKALLDALLGTNYSSAITSKQQFDNLVTLVAKKLKST